MTSLLVMVPTRWRRENCERLLKSFTEATDSADLVFVLDKDDEDTYKDMDWGTATCAILDLDGKGTGAVAKMNYLAAAAVDDYDALMYLGDDHLFSTPHWDTILLSELAEMGGTGMLYGDDKRRTDIPESILISSDIVKTLGHFAEPSTCHYFCDNVWAELGIRSGLLRFCPEVVFEHLHYQVNRSVEYDQTYRFAEANWGVSDHKAFLEWRSARMSNEVSLLRREFNPDVKWVREAF